MDLNDKCYKHLVLLPTGWKLGLVDLPPGWKPSPVDLPPGWKPKSDSSSGVEDQVPLDLLVSASWLDIANLPEGWILSPLHTKALVGVTSIPEPPPDNRSKHGRPDQPRRGGLGLTNSDFSQVNSIIGPSPPFWRYSDFAQPHTGTSLAQSP